MFGNQKQRTSQLIARLVCLSSAVNTPGFSEGSSPAHVSDFLATSEDLALTRAFTRIADAKMRRSIVDLVEQVAAREGPDKR